MRRILREPIVHFLLIGALLFATYPFSRERTPAPPDRIVVDRGQIEQLAAQFERTWMRPPRSTELEALIENHVREEVYYREALALGLDRDDPVIRQRMRLKLEFLLEDLSVGDTPADSELQRFVESRPDRFMPEQRISFRQVYLSPDRRAAPEVDAERIIAELRSGASPEGLGDPSLLPDRYDQESVGVIARSFGEEFAERLAVVETGQWLGPLRSGVGMHVVRVDERLAPRLPDLPDIREQVIFEWQAERRREMLDQTYGRLREQYEVIIEAEPGEAPPDGGSMERSVSR